MDSLYVHIVYAQIDRETNNQTNKQTEKSLPEINSINKNKQTNKLSYPKVSCSVEYFVVC